MLTRSNRLDTITDVNGPRISLWNSVKNNPFYRDLVDQIWLPNTNLVAIRNTTEWARYENSSNW